MANFLRVTPRLVNARPPGCAKLAKAPSLGLTGQANTLQLTWLGGGRKGGGGAEKRLTHTFHLKNRYRIHRFATRAISVFRVRFTVELIC